MASYFAMILPVTEGGYAVIFPDFPEAFTQGGTVEEAVEMGADALALTVEEYAKARKLLPDPSSVEIIRERLAKEMREDCDMAREPLIQLFRAPEIDLTPVKINVSLPRGLLTSIDERARMCGMTRSGYLAEAARAYGA